MVNATGIGSVPHKDVKSICDFILDRFPDMPFWPQLFKVSPRENLFVQFTENLPCLEPDLDRKTVRVNKRNQEQELLSFYDYFDHNCYEYFRIGNEYARGFHALVETIQKNAHPCPFVKGQVIGPITFLSTIIGDNGKALIHDDIMSDAIIKGLATKAVWQAKEIEKMGKIPIIFFDEPYLSSFGSAFVPLERGKVIEILNQMIRILREKAGARTGIHCCGNTDWSMLLETDADILSLDSYGFGEYFTLYANEIKKFLNREGVVAWGVVPTAEYRASISLDEIKKRFTMCLNNLASRGIDTDMLLRHSLITPSCGTGLMREADATRVHNLTAELSADLPSPGSIIEEWIHA
jgi:hypothetical protein